MGIVDWEMYIVVDWPQLAEVGDVAEDVDVDDLVVIVDIAAVEVGQGS